MRLLPHRLLLALALAALLGAVGFAQERSSGDGASGVNLAIPGGIVRRGQGQCVTLQKDAREQVALVHCEVGDQLLLMLPNGRLEFVAKGKTEPTTQAFAAATKDELAAELKRKFPDFKSRSTKRYLYIYNTSDQFYTGTSRILETMYPAILAYFKRLKFPVHDPQVPLVAIMFRTEEEFRKYEQAPAGVAAYYNIMTNQIVMYEQSKLVDLAPELAVKQSIGVVAHEGIHQILHNIGVQERLSRWPLWTSEGLAEYFAPTSVDKRLRWKGVGMPHDLRMHELEKYLKQPETSPGEMIEHTVEAPGLTSAGYASAWALTHYLASRQKEKFQDYLREVAKLGPLEPRDPKAAAAEGKKLFIQFFGSDFSALQDKVIKHLQSLPYTDPIANQTHYVVMLDTAAMKRVGVTTSPASVRQWQDDTLTKLPANVRAQARFQVMAFANKTAAETYARQWLGN